MTQRIDGEALKNLTRFLGTVGSASSTEVDDGNISLVVDLNSLVRRARALGVTEGWFTGVLDNIHTAGGAESSEINPYAPTVANVQAVASYPGIVQPGFDIWVMGGSILRISGAGDLDGANLCIDPVLQQQGWGIDSAGSAVATSGQFPVLRWIAGLDVSVAAIPHAIGGDGSAFPTIKVRIGRGSLLRFHSDAAAAATFRLTLVLALLPEAVGQDVFA